MCHKTNGSRGNANNRRIRQQIAELNNQIAKGPKKAFIRSGNQPFINDVCEESTAAHSLSDVAKSRKLVMQMAEETASEEPHIKMNPFVAI